MIASGMGEATIFGPAGHSEEVSGGRDLAGRAFGKLGAPLETELDGALPAGSVGHPGINQPDAVRWQESWAKTFAEQASQLSLPGSDRSEAGQSEASQSRASQSRAIQSEAIQSRASQSGASLPEEDLSATGLVSTGLGLTGLVSTGLVLTGLVATGLADGFPGRAASSRSLSPDDFRVGTELGASGAFRRDRGEQPAATVSTGGRANAGARQGAGQIPLSNLRGTPGAQPGDEYGLGSRAARLAGESHSALSATPAHRAAKSAPIGRTAKTFGVASGHVSIPATLERASAPPEPALQGLQPFAEASSPVPTAPVPTVPISTVPISTVLAPTAHVPTVHVPTVHVPTVHVPTAAALTARLRLAPASTALLQTAPSPTAASPTAASLTGKSAALPVLPVSIPAVSIPVVPVPSVPVPGPQSFSGSGPQFLTESNDQRGPEMTGTDRSSAPSSLANGKPGAVQATGDASEPSERAGSSASDGAREGFSPQSKAVPRALPLVTGLSMGPSTPSAGRDRSEGVSAAVAPLADAAEVPAATRSYPGIGSESAGGRAQGPASDGPSLATASATSSATRVATGSIATSGRLQGSGRVVVAAEQGSAHDGQYGDRYGDQFGGRYGNSQPSIADSLSEKTSGKTFTLGLPDGAGSISVQPSTAPPAGASPSTSAAHLKAGEPPSAEQQDGLSGAGGGRGAGDSNGVGNADRIGSEPAVGPAASTRYAAGASQLQAADSSPVSASTGDLASSPLPPRLVPGSGLVARRQEAKRLAADPLNQMAQAGSVGALKGAPDASAAIPGAPPRGDGAHFNPFEAMDGAATAASLTGSRTGSSGAERMPAQRSAAPSQLQVGYDDPVLGYVELRAQSDSSGIHASLGTRSDASGAVLAGDLNSLAAWMDARHTPVESLSVVALSGSPDLPAHASAMGDKPQGWTGGDTGGGLQSGAHAGGSSGSDSGSNNRGDPESGLRISAGNLTQTRTGTLAGTDWTPAATSERSSGLADAAPSSNGGSISILA